MNAIARFERERERERLSVSAKWQGELGHARVSGDRKCDGTHRADTCGRAGHGACQAGEGAAAATLED